MGEKLFFNYFFQKSGKNKIKTVNISKRPTYIDSAITYFETSGNVAKQDIMPDGVNPIPPLPMDSATAEKDV